MRGRACVWSLLASAVAVAQSPGCGAAQHPGVAGRTVDYERPYAGQALMHRLTLPAAYQPATPSALLLFFHGWGASATTCGALCDAEAPAAGFVALSMQGIGSSWNGSGSVASPGARGATCGAECGDSPALGGSTCPRAAAPIGPMGGPG